MGIFEKLISCVKPQKESEPKEVDPIERRRHPRFVPQIENSLAVSGKKANLVNISRSGMLIKLLDEHGFSKDEILEISLIFSDNTAECSARIAWMDGGSFIGVEFVETTLEFSKILDKFLKPHFLGNSLREINAEYLKSDGENDLRWWQGYNDTNIFVWNIASEISQFQVVFLDYIIEWKEGKALKTGELSGDRSKSGFGRSDPYFAVFYNIPRQEVLENAKTLLNASKVEGKIKEFISNEIVKEEKRLFLRFAVEDTYLKAGDEKYSVKEVSYCGFGINGSSEIQANTGELVFEKMKCSVRIEFKEVHNNGDISGYKILNILENEQEFAQILRKLAIGEM